MPDTLAPPEAPQTPTARTYYNWRAIMELILRQKLALDEFHTVMGEFPPVTDELTFNQTRTQQIQLLLNYVQSHDQIQQLLEAIHAENPNAYREFEARLRSNTEQTAEAADSLNALARLLADSAGLRQVIPEGFAARFDDARRQIRVVALYKEVHDLLHSIERETFNGLLSEHRYFPDDPRAGINLARYQTRLALDTSRMEEFAAQSRADAVLLAPRIYIAHVTLRTSLKQLQDALEGCDKGRLEAAIGTLREAVTIQQSQFNTALFKAAGHLDLPAVVSTLNTVAVSLADVGGETGGHAGAFERTVAALDALSFNLDTLIREHDNWQMFSDLMRTISPVSEEFMTTLAMSWPVLKGMMEPLRSRVSMAWLALLDEAVQAMEAALASGNLFQGRMRFGQVCELVYDRFFQVDVTLKNLCHDLRSVGESLYTVLAALRPD